METAHNTSELTRFCICISLMLFVFQSHNSLRATNPNLNVCTAYRKASWQKSHRIVHHPKQPCHVGWILANGCSMQWLGQPWSFGRLVSFDKKMVGFRPFFWQSSSRTTSWSGLPRRRWKMASANESTGKISSPADTSKWRATTWWTDMRTNRNGVPPYSQVNTSRSIHGRLCLFRWH